MTKKRFLIWAIVIAFIHIGLVVFFGGQKQGFHEDEYYTYWSVSSDHVEPANFSWRSGYELQSRFFVIEGDQFSFDMVVENQADDVHPPLYYLALHVFMSLFTNSFYKWFSILLNLLFSLVTYVSILFFFLCLREKDARNRQQLALLAGLVYAVAPSTISSVMLTRMYAMSTMWTALYAVVFVMLLNNIGCSRKRFAFLTVAGAVVCYCAFLTHYYALFVPFFLTAAYCIYSLVRRKEFVRMLVYGVSVVAAILLAVLTYPACITHIFRGYRGADAINGFFTDPLFDKTGLFIGWINDCVFAGWMLPCIVVFLIFAVIGILLVVRTKKNREVGLFAYKMVSLGITCMASFWVLTRLALMVGEESSRYFYPVIALALPFMAYTVAAVIGAIKDVYIEPKLQLKGRKIVTIVLAIIVLLVVMLPIVHVYSKEKVLFLYKADREKIAFAEEYSEYPLIIVYDQEKTYRSWYVDNQVWPFEEVFYVEVNHMSQIDDEKLFEAEKIVVYMDAPEEFLQHIIDNNPNLSDYTLVRHDKFFYVYLLE